MSVLHRLSKFLSINTLAAPRGMDKIQEKFPKITAADVANIKQWTAFGRGRFSGNAGAFWLSIIKKVPKTYQKTSKPYLYRGFKLKYTDAIKAVNGELTPPKKSVESWTTRAHTGTVYSASDTKIGLVVRTRPAKVKVLLSLSEEFLNIIYGQERIRWRGTVRNKVLVNVQDEVICKGGYRINPKDIQLLNAKEKFVDRLSEEFGINPPKGKRATRYILNFTNGKPGRVWKAIK